MMQDVEISKFDLRYEDYRMKNKGVEDRLLCSIRDEGIREPLEGVDTVDGHILLNGFKRYRCAKSLGIGKIPYLSLGSDEALGIIHLIKVSNSKTLSILEQAKLIEDLRKVHQMPVSEIARMLERSKSWVSVRLGIIGQMSDFVMKQIFEGKFPAYCYMYTINQFIRINSVTKEEIDEFVKLVSDKNLSIRNIEKLAHGYFKGPDEFREQIRSGDILWGLEHLDKSSIETNHCNGIERTMLSDLEIVYKYMRRVSNKSTDKRFKNNSFFAQANILANKILNKINIFSKALREFHDRSGQA